MIISVEIRLDAKFVDRLDSANQAFRMTEMANRLLKSADAGGREEIGGFSYGFVQELEQREYRTFVLICQERGAGGMGIFIKELLGYSVL